jgi:hypothetical protein
VGDPGRRAFVVKKCVIPLWILGSAWVVSDLLPPAGSKPDPGYWTYLVGSVVSYSLPFCVLMIIRIPESWSPQRYILLTLFALVLAINLFVPVRPFLPGYHPKALDGLVYLVLPPVELGLIALFFVVAAAATFLFGKGSKA